MIKLGNTHINRITLGNATVNKVTLGSQIVWEAKRTVTLTTTFDTVDLYNLIDSANIYSYYASNPSKIYGCGILSHEGNSCVVQVPGGDTIFIGGVETYWKPAGCEHDSWNESESAVTGGSFSLSDTIELPVSIPSPPTYTFIAPSNSGNYLTYSVLLNDTGDYFNANADLYTINGDFIASANSPDINVESYYSVSDSSDKYGTHYTYTFTNTHGCDFNSITLPIFGRISSVKFASKSIGNIYWNSSSDILRS